MHSLDKITSPVKARLNEPDWLLIIGAGVGGPQALSQILPLFPSDFPGAVVVVQQMRRGFTRVLADRLNQMCGIHVYEPVDGQALQASRILIAPGGTQLGIERMELSSVIGYNILLEDSNESHDVSQSLTDYAMNAAAQNFGTKTIGVLLTGTGSDGREGMRAIAAAGGITIAQDEASSTIYDLPSSAIDAGVVQEVLPLWKIAERVISIVTGEINAVAA